MNTESTSLRRIPVKIDGLSIDVAPGTTILSAANRLEIDIPTLCHHPDLRPIGSCRMCVVEVLGRPDPVTSCDFEIAEPIEVQTHTYKLWRSRRDTINKIFEQHYGWPTRGFVYCHMCPRDGTCQLQKLATEYGVTHPSTDRPPAPPVVLFGETLEYEQGKCIQCERCLRTCEELQGVGAIRMETDTPASLTAAPKSDAAAHRYPKLENPDDCFNCGQCAARCSTAALRPKNSYFAVQKALKAPSRHVVIQTAPAPRGAITEEFGLKSDVAATPQLNTALRMLGFDAVLDTCLSADLTVIEEGSELLGRLFHNRQKPDPHFPLPLFTSCCPSWVRFLEHAYPDMLPHLSTCKSPQQMMGAYLKTRYAEQKKLPVEDIISVSLMPCVAKKAECVRPEMKSGDIRHVDHVLSTRECALLLRDKGIHLPLLDPGEFDNTFAGPSGSGVIFGHTGGVMESALRTVLDMVTGASSETSFDAEPFEAVPGFDGCRMGTIRFPNKTAPVPPLLEGRFEDFSWLAGTTLKVAVVSGLRPIRQVIQSLMTGHGPFATCQFIELMSCPGGCVAGGGQPALSDINTPSQRRRALRMEDRNYGEQGLAQKSHENETLLRLYREWLTEGPGRGLAHTLLHTQ